MHLRLFILIIPAILLFSSCHQEKQDKIRPSILVTTGMLSDLVQNIVGNHIDVNTLMNSGVDPHLYKASLNDLKGIISADILIYNGLHLEGKLSKVLDKQRHIKPTIGLGDYLENPITLDKGVYDPHIWFDVRNWIELSDITLDTLERLFPEYERDFQNNHRIYKQKLIELDSWVRNEINQLPLNRRIMVTAHDAFNYFGRSYGITVRGLQGISTLTEFGLRDVTNLVDYIVMNQIPSVFIETSVSSKSINAVVSGVEKRGHHLKIGGSLYSDSMGKKGTEEGTYIGMFRHNVRTLVKALK